MFIHGPSGPHLPKFSSPTDCIMQQASESSSSARHNNSRSNQWFQQPKSQLQVDTKDLIGPPRPPEMGPESPTSPRRSFKIHPPPVPQHQLCYQNSADDSTPTRVVKLQSPCKALQASQLDIEASHPSVDASALPPVQTARSQLHAEPPTNHRQPGGARRSQRFSGEPIADWVYCVWVQCDRVWVPGASTNRPSQLVKSNYSRATGWAPSAPGQGSQNYRSLSVIQASDSVQPFCTRLTAPVDSPIAICLRPRHLITMFFTLAHAQQVFKEHNQLHSARTQDIESLKPSELRQLLRNQIVQNLSVAQNKTVLNPFCNPQEHNFPRLAQARSTKPVKWKSPFDKLDVCPNGRKSLWVKNVKSNNRPIDHSLTRTQSMIISAHVKPVSIACIEHKAAGVVERWLSTPDV